MTYIKSEKKKEVKFQKGFQQQEKSKLPESGQKHRIPDMKI